MPGKAKTLKGYPLNSLAGEIGKVKDPGSMNQPARSSAGETVLHQLEE